MVPFTFVAGILMIGGLSNTFAQENSQLVRMAKLRIDSTQLESYKAVLREEIEASVRLEPGVLALYAVSEKARPAHITIFETYASTEAYKAHLETPHFKKYKTGTVDMVKGLDLVQTRLIFFGTKPETALVQYKNIVVQLARLQINVGQLENYKVQLKEGMETSVRSERGVLTLYAVSEKDNPTHIKVLEIYADSNAYKAHLETPHFRKYKATTTDMVTAIELVPVTPIRLGAKPH